MLFIGANGIVFDSSYIHIESDPKLIVVKNDSKPHSLEQQSLY